VNDLEQRTMEIGRGLFRQVRSAEQFRPPMAWAADAAMALVMRDPAVKTQLFRLVDCLPALHSAREINRHLKEYLHGANDLLAACVPKNGFFGNLTARVAMLAAQRMAHQFIAAADVEEAVAVCLEMRKANLAFTIDVLGEAVVSEAEAERYAEQYFALIDGLSDRLAVAEPVDLIDRAPQGRLARVNVSIKLSSLFSQFDAIDPDGALASVGRRLRPILLRARSRGAFVYFDMESFAHKNATLHIFKHVLMEKDFRDWTDVGIAIQAYLQSCGDDLAGLADWARQRGSPVWVRLVKGAYWDYEVVNAAQKDWPIPVYTQKPATDANFERQTEFLIQHHDLLHPAIAGHNVRGIAHALALAEQFNLPPRTIEFQMLHGMADSIKTALVESGQRVRIYLPVGKLLPGMAYLVRRLLENTSNESFLRAGFLEQRNEEELLMNPVMLLKPEKVAAHDEFRNEPPTDFSRDSARKSMQQALATVKSRMPTEHPLVIGGKRRTSGSWIESINPSHKSQIVGKSAFASAAQAIEAIGAAKAAFEFWRERPANDRADLLDRVAGILRQRRLELAAVEVYECGKPWREADGDVAEAIDFCTYYAQEARRLGAGRHSDMLGETNEHFYEPRGVTVVIAPWNFPLAILCGMTAAAVVTGNTVIMKPAEQSPIIAAMLMEAFEQAGCPPGVVNYLPGVGEEVGPVLVEHPDVATIAFTGSRAVGLSITATAAQTPPGQRHVKHVIAEMGGKNAIIVDADADLDEAIAGVVQSAFGYAGQKCSACSRLIVLDEIHDAFLNRLIEAAASIRIAPAEAPACFVGPVIDAQAYQSILAAIERGKAEAKLAFAGDVGDLIKEGFFIAPHIFSDVPPYSFLAQEEIFGPVLSVLRAKDLTQAIEIANAVPYALTGGLYSRSPANIDRVRRRFRVGNLYINRKITGALVGRQPFGGFALSGMGTKAGGPDYLLQFLLPRVVTENTLRHGFAPPA
jgi:RHH-type transcriptional regulator, proline utilization regulon repressor / proline dehydrogenase / delta 1-pyrroline-5-carboxylate dehydrogenase